MITSRRNFLVGSLATLFAAPAIVRCGSLMPVKAMPDLLPPQLSFEEIMARAYALTRKAIEENLYNNMFPKWDEEVRKDNFLYGAHR